MTPIVFDYPGRYGLEIPSSVSERPSAYPPSVLLLLNFGSINFPPLPPGRNAASSF